MSQLFKTGIVVSKGNSTNIPLAAYESFIGKTDDVTSYEEVDINLFGEPYNAPGSLYFEFSSDGYWWDVSIEIGGTQLSGPSIPPQVLRVVLPYFRVRYVNGNITQTTFRLTTVFHRSSGTRLTRYLNQYMDNTEGVDNTRSIISGYRPDNSYGNISINSENMLMVDTTSPQIKTEYDVSSSSVNYIGTAPSGTATSAALWTIKKITFDVLGNPLETTWSSNTAIWENRASEIYT